MHDMAARPSGRGAFSRPPILGIPESAVRWSMRRVVDWGPPASTACFPETKSPSQLPDWLGPVVPLQANRPTEGLRDAYSDRVVSGGQRARARRARCPASPPKEKPRPEKPGLSLCRRSTCRLGGAGEPIATRRSRQQFPCQINEGVTVARRRSARALM